MKQKKYHQMAHAMRCHFLQKEKDGKQIRFISCFEALLLGIKRKLDEVTFGPASYWASHHILRGNHENNIDIPNCVYPIVNF